MSDIDLYKNLLQQLVAIIRKKRSQVDDSPIELVRMYWKLRHKIANYMQSATKIATSGNCLKKISSGLTDAGMSGFSVAHLKNISKFYSCYPSFKQLHPAVKWSHYLLLIKINATEQRNFYEQMIVANKWSVSQLSGHIQQADYQQALKLRKDFPYPHYGLATVYACQNKSAQALDHLQLALQKGFADIAYIHNNPQLDSIRNLQKFRDLIERYEQR